LQQISKINLLWQSIGKARTRANDDVTCSVSYESAPSLAPNRSLAAVHL